MRTAILRVRKREQKVDVTKYLFYLLHIWHLQSLSILYLTSFSSSSSASRVSPVHSEPAKADSSPLQRHQQLSGQGAPPASALWIFSSRVTAEVKDWCPLSAGGHTAVPSEGEGQDQESFFKGAIDVFFTLSSMKSSCGVLLSLWKHFYNILCSSRGSL